MTKGILRLTRRIWKVAISGMIVASLSACDTSVYEKNDAPSAVADDVFVQAFMGNCVQNFPDLTKIEAAAIASGWKLITDPATLEMIGPAGGGGEWKAWGFKYQEKGFMLATGQNEVEGLRVSFCVLISEPTDIKATRTKIVDLLRATRLGESEEAGQRYETYEFKLEGRTLLLNFVDATPMGLKMLNVSANMVIDNE